MPVYKELHGSASLLVVLEQEESHFHTLVVYSAELFSE